MTGVLLDTHVPARQLNLALVTADEKLLAYGAQGHLTVISAR